MCWHEVALGDFDDATGENISFGPVNLEVSSQSAVRGKVDNLAQLPNASSAALFADLERYSRDDVG